MNKKLIVLYAILTLSICVIPFRVLGPSPIPTWTFIDDDNQGGTYYDMYEGDALFVAADTTLYAYGTDLSTVNLLTSATDGPDYLDVSGDIRLGTDGYVYTAKGTGGLEVYDYNSIAYTLTPVYNYTDEYVNAIWTDDTPTGFIHSINLSGGELRALWYDTGFSMVSEQDMISDGGEYQCVWGDNDFGTWDDVYVYVGRNSYGLSDYYWDGAMYTLQDTILNGSGVILDIWGTEISGVEYVFAATDSDGVFAYEVATDGTFSWVDNISCPAGETAVSVYGQDTFGASGYVYVAWRNTGIDIYSFDGTEFTFLNRTGTGLIDNVNLYSEEIISDKYLWVTQGTDGLYFYEMEFPTSPTVEPTGFTADHTSCKNITLNWTNDATANYTYIRRDALRDDMQLFDDFETGTSYVSGNYTSGGSNSYRSTSYRYEGVASFLALDNWGDGSSFSLTNAIDLSNHTNMSIDFWWMWRGNGWATNEDWFVEYYNGTTWQTVLDTNYPGGGTKSVWYHRVVWVNSSSYTYPTNANIKFRCDASYTDDLVYFDNIYINITDDRTEAYPTDRTRGVFVYNGTSDTFMDSGLTPSTTYYYSAWGYNSSLSNYSANYSTANTTTHNVPTVTTNATTSPTSLSSILNGYCSDTDTLNLTWTGFQYGLTTAYGSTLSKAISSSPPASYWATYDESPELYGTEWYAQSFIPSFSHNITSVNLWLKKSGTPGTLTVRIRSSLTGSDLTTGTYNANLLTGSFQNITIPITAYNLQGGITYYFTLGISGASPNTVQFESRNPGGYANGQDYYSHNSGSTWYSGSGDILFSEYGNVYGFGTFYDTLTTTPVTVYHYRGFATSDATGYGTDLGFLSPPYAPTSNPSITRSGTGFSLIWTNSPTSDRTVIRGKIGSYPSSPTGDVAIYNDTGFSTTHTGLSEGDTWYYRAWSWAEDSGYSAYSTNYSEGYMKVVVNATITTNATTGIGTTNATMRGYMSANGSSITQTTFSFQYGYNVSYGSTVSVGSSWGITEFYADVPSLTSGHVYHYRAVATNSNGTSYGSDMVFVTQPTVTGSFTATDVNANHTQYLTWTHGTGSNATVIRVGTSGFPADPTAGTGVYNGTGLSCYYSVSMVGQLYYYRAWEYSAWGTYHQFSNYSRIGCLTQPYAPILSALPVIINGTSINISWTKGTGANNTIIVSNQYHHPTSATDGTVHYNGTGTYHICTISPRTPFYFTLYSYTQWTYNPTVHTHSWNGTNISWSLLGFNCFNESNNAPIPFNMLITTKNGSFVRYFTGLTNTYLLNISNVTTGEELSLVISSTGYKQRTYVQTFSMMAYYNLSFFLPTVSIPGGEGDEYVIRPFTDSIIVTNPAVDNIINFTMEYDSLISIEVYNESISEGYGGWVPVPIGYYTITNTSCTINESILATNTTMARVTYYYRDYGDLETLIYMLTILGPTTSYGSSTPIQDALIIIKNYVNETGEYVEVSSGYSDSEGKFSCYMISYESYKIFVTKDGYKDTITDFIADPNIRTKTIRLEYIDDSPPSGDYEPSQVHFSYVLGYIAGNTTYVINLTYLDTTGFTNSTTLVVTAYNFTTNTSTVILTETLTNDSSWTKQIWGIDRNMTYKCVVTVTHYYIGVFDKQVLIEKQIWIPITPAEVNAMFSWMGIVPFGAVNLLMFALWVGICFNADSRDFGKYTIVIGIIFMFLGGYVGMQTPLFGTVGALFGGALPVLFIAMGILIEWNQAKRKVYN